MSNTNFNIWIWIFQFILKFSIWIDFINSKRILNILYQWVFIQNFFIKINQLVIIILNFRAIPFIFLKILYKIALSICVNSDFQIFSLISINTDWCNRIFNCFKWFIYIIISIKKGSFICSFKCSNALLSW
jgi:hypothetical protein